MSVALSQTAGELEADDYTNLLVALGRKREYDLTDEVVAWVRAHSRVTLPGRLFVTVAQARLDEGDYDAAVCALNWTRLHAYEPNGGCFIMENR